MKLKIVTYVFAVLCLVSCKTTNKATDANNKPLVGTQWNLVAIHGERIDSNQVVQPFIVFQEDGTYNGNLGCNTFFGNYHSKKQKIELNYAGSTKRLCHEMATEQHFIKAMREEVNNFSIVGNTLTLFAGKVEVLRFEN